MATVQVLRADVEAERSDTIARVVWAGSRSDGVALVYAMSTPDIVRVEISEATINGVAVKVRGWYRTATGPELASASRADGYGWDDASPAAKTVAKLAVEAAGKAALGLPEFVAYQGVMEQRYLGYDIDRKRKEIAELEAGLVKHRQELAALESRQVTA